MRKPAPFPELTDEDLDRVHGGDCGLDAKVGVTAGLTADLTYRTDFAQVEADEQQVNLTQFPTFFPEKREFFLESSGVFDFGSAEQAQLFYSRRVGLDPRGAAVPILGGGRLYGKLGVWALGLLGAGTGEARGGPRRDLNTVKELTRRIDAGEIPVADFSKA